jgi:hypothetical protein
LQQTATAIARELEWERLTKQAFDEWEKGKTHVRVDAYAAWCAVLGLQLEIDAVPGGEDGVTVRVPRELSSIVRSFVTLAPADKAVVSELIVRLKRD